MLRNRELSFLNEDGSIITADSIPDLDDWGYDSWWDCHEWINWHRANRKKYGLETANAKFAKSWNEQGSLSGALNCRTFDSDFRDYIARVGLYDTVWKGAGGFKYILQPAGAIIQTTGTVAGGVFKGVGTTGQLMKWLLPTLAIGSVVLLGVYGYRVATRRKV